MAPATDVLSNISTVNPDTVPSSQSPCHLLSGSDLSPTQTVHQMSPKLVNVKPVEITIVTRSKSIIYESKYKYLTKISVPKIVEVVFNKVFNKS